MNESGSPTTETGPDADRDPNGTAVDDDTADTMRGRVDESRLKLWLLLRANRLVVAGVLVGAVFVAFVAVAVA